MLQFSTVGLMAYVERLIGADIQRLPPACGLHRNIRSTTDIALGMVCFRLDAIWLGVNT